MHDVEDPTEAQVNLDSTQEDTMLKKSKMGEKSD